MFVPYTKSRVRQQAPPRSFPLIQAVMEKVLAKTLIVDCTNKHAGG